MRRLSVVTAVLVALLAAAGCGSTEPDTVGTPSASATTSPSPSSTGSTAPAAPTSGGTVDPQAPTTAGAARTVIDSVAGGVAPPVDAPTFVTPDGIYCNLGDDGVVPPSCEPPEPTVEDPAYCAGAPTTRIGRLELDAGVPNPVCSTDTIRTEDATPLPVGRATPATGHAMQCVSQEIGVTCLDTGGTGTSGFFVGTEGFVILT